jgi:hypothetical protein
MCPFPRFAFPPTYVVSRFHCFTRWRFDHFSSCLSQRITTESSSGSLVLRTSVALSCPAVRMTAAHTPVVRGTPRPRKSPPSLPGPSRPHSRAAGPPPGPLLPRHRLPHPSGFPARCARSKCHLPFEGVEASCCEDKNTARTSATISRITNISHKALAAMFFTSFVEILDSVGRRVEIAACRAEGVAVELHQLLEARLLRVETAHQVRLLTRRRIL